MLSEEITKLAVAVRAAVAGREAVKLIPSIERQLIRRKDWNLKYHDDIGFANFQSGRRVVRLWDLRDQEEFQTSFVEGFDGYRALATSLGQKARMLDQFVHSLSSAALQGLDDGELQARVHAICCELEDKPLPATVTAYIDGMSVEGPSVRVSDAMVLRKPTEDDLAEEVLGTDDGGSIFPLGDTWFRVVGEFVFDEVHLGGAQRQFLSTINALRLFRVGGVEANRYRTKSRRLISGGTSFGPRRPSPFTYALLDSEVDSLATFLNDIIPLLPDPFQPDNASTDVGIAHARYADALFAVGGPEKTITSAITALEALFLENAAELTHRLAQRSAMFLKLLGYGRDPKSTYSNVKEGYQIRSTFIHGGFLKDKDQPRAKVLVPVLLDYTRRCVLARIQMRSAISKSELLAKLDESMLDISVRRKLGHSLRGLILH